MNLSLGGIFTFYDISNTSVYFENKLRPAWKYGSGVECMQSMEYLRKAHTDERKWCNGTWDTYLCWPPVPAGKTVYLPCPPLLGLDPNQRAFRKCNSDGRWDGAGHIGYTNYTACYNEESRRILTKFYGNKSDTERQMIKDIVVGTRMMEISGLCISLFAAFLSLFIFSYFRSLRCHRTRIHKNLLVAIIVQTVIRLILYLDQYLARRYAQIAIETGIFHTHVYCEAIYTLLEHTASVQFMWMLVEGIHLHNIITVSIFSARPNFTFYYLIGWGTPVPFTLAWVITMSQKHNSSCWFPYYFLPHYWIIEAPRVAVIALNFMFLLNIIRVLVQKLRHNYSQEPQVMTVSKRYVSILTVEMLNDVLQKEHIQEYFAISCGYRKIFDRKAVKAAIVLLPLLGITNIVKFIDPPTKVLHFGLWSFTTFFLVSFQGFFISLIYCYLNGEVQMAIKTQWDRIKYNLGLVRRKSRSTSHSVQGMESNSCINAQTVGNSKEDRTNSSQFATTSLLHNMSTTVSSV